MKDRIIIFDTTLRDGEQSPGASLTTREKLRIAHQLVKLGVDIIEAGFPIASEGDFEAVSKISRVIKGAVVAGLARCLQKDIETAFRALEKAEDPCIHIFLATSRIHREFKLKKAKEEIIRQAVKSVKLARKYVDRVEFSPEDAARTELPFLTEVVEAVIEAGATTVNIPDTVGYSTPEEFGEIIRCLKREVSNIDRAIISVHCHNDLGLAVANSLSAIKNGARQVECCINGLGERAGNASLEEVVMALKVRKDFWGVTTGINTRQIYKTSRLVSHLTGIPVQRNKAIVGENAFAHEAGIHQDGILKERTTYEIMRPQDVGVPKSLLVLGKHSGRHAFNEKLKALGYRLSPEELDRSFVRFKTLADKKKHVFDDDIESLVDEQLDRPPAIFSLEYFNVTSGNRTVPTATVQLRKGDKVFQDASCGDGPVDAACRAVDRITGITGELLKYELRGVTGGKDALGEVVVQFRSGRRTVHGRASSTDIIEASVKAYLAAVNKIAARKDKPRKK
ncbi:MAG: 2-isopropylmalate synthase [Candidatus Euphemobacter frigidus]|nr:2-isopropylmalate synthase [Candidatus Euphemobacter frigidus]MDP8275767.1 2-isopropylmalate synthase [Candidatus Euphemobacter frigidus]